MSTGPADPQRTPVPAAHDRDQRYHAATRQDLEEVGAQRRVYRLGSDSSQRLDQYLHNRLKGMSRNQIQKLIALGGVTVNGKDVKASLSLRRGDAVEVIVPPRPSVDLHPEPIALDVLYEDEHMIVINKHAGIIVHPARSYKSGTMVNALAWHFQHSRGGELSEVGQAEQRPGVVHRLDMNTTGVIVFAKREQTHWLLAKQFENRTNLKCYLALVHGCPEPPSGAIDQPLGKHPTIREAHAVRHDPTGKPSLTLYRVRRRYRGYSLIECELKSGRTHQIRVHLSYLGHPIVGDQLYGGELVGEAELAQPPPAAGARPAPNYARSKSEGARVEALAAGRRDAGELVMASPALHAALLRLDHPLTKASMTFTAPLHPPMHELVRRLEAQCLVEGQTITDGTHIDLIAALG